MSNAEFVSAMNDHDVWLNQYDTYGRSSAGVGKKMVLSRVLIDGTKHSCAARHLRYASIVNSHLIRFNVDRADFTATNLEGTRIEDANLERAIFKDSILRGVSFRGSRLYGADFRNVDLSGADLSHALLAGANFSGANLSGVKGLPSSAEMMEKMFRRDGDGWIVYKAVGDTPYDPRPEWQFHAGSFLTEVVDWDRASYCGCGVNFGSIGYIGNTFIDRSGSPFIKVWKCRIHWVDAADIVIPFMSDGRGRCARLELLETINFWSEV